jgi:uncharacterized protein (TIGR03437 family)
MFAPGRLVVAWLVLFFSVAAHSQGVISTFAGTDALFPSDGQPAIQARFGTLIAATADRQGNVYLADLDAAIVARIGTDGFVRVVAGNGIRTVGGDGGPATKASLGSSGPMAVDSSGNLYLVDNINNQVRKVSADGTITRFAGTGEAGFSGDGGPATRARLNLGSGTAGIATDSSGNVYFSDRGNLRIRRVAPDGTISTFAGTGPVIPGQPGDGSPALNVAINPGFLLFDSAGALLFCDGNRVRKVLPSGIVAPVAGLGPGGFSGDGDAAISALLRGPNSLAQDSNGNLFIYDFGNARVRRVDRNGTITTVAGNGQLGFSGDGGPAVQARLASFSNGGIVTDPAGNLLIADSSNARVRKVTPAGLISTIAGIGSTFVGEGAPATSANIPSPSGIALDAAGNLYIADQNLNRALRVTADGIIRTLAGQGDAGSSGDGGPAILAQLNGPRKIALDAAGNIYIAELSNHKVRRISPAGVITTFAGTGASGYSGDNLPATSATLTNPFAVAADRQGNIYIADTGNGRIRKVAPDGIITTVAGNGISAYAGDGGPATQGSFRNAIALGIDSAGSLYIVDAADHRIRKVTNRIISTVAGIGTAGFSGDGGPATAAALRTPEGIAFDSAGNFYIADALNHRIRKVTPGGIISTVAGVGTQGFSGDGGPPLAAQINLPFDVAIDGSGNLFIAEVANGRIRVVRSAAPSFTVAPATLSFSGTSGGAPSAGQPIALTPTTAGLSYAVSANAPWLTVTPASGFMPVAVQAVADPSTLAPGKYTGVITFTAPNALPAARSVDVTFNVQQLIPPKLSASPAALSFALTNQSAPQSQTLRVSNDGAGSLSFTATASTSSGGTWLKVSAGGGAATPSAPFALTVTADSKGLAPGTYSGQVALVASSQSLIVPVTFSVSAVPQTILLSQTGLTFVAVASGGRVPSDTVGILNTGQGAMNWTAKASTLKAGPAWLSVTPASGTTTAGSLSVPLIEIAVDATGLAAGDYYGQVRIDAPGASNSPQSVSVVLTVLPAGSNPGPVVRPTGLIFTGVAGGSSPSSQDALISNVTSSAVNYVSGRLTSDGANWLLQAPVSGAVAPDAPTRIVVQTDLTSLSPGIRRGVVTLLFLEDGNTRNVNLLLNVLPSAASSAARTAGGCSPTRLLAVFTLLPDNFVVPVAWPTPVELRVADDCGNALTGGSVAVSFSNGDPPISLAPLGDGRWAATWQPRNGQVSQVTVTATAQDPSGNLRGSAQATGGLRANPSPPVISSGAVLSAASFAPQAPLSPGSLIAIFGSHLADTVALAPSLPWSKELAGSTVVLAGRALPLQYASDGQINAIIPYDVPVNTQQQLIVQRGSSYAVPESVTLSAAEPAIFTTSQSGSGQGLIVDVDTNLVDRRHPATPGDAIVIYCTGLGAVDSAVEAGTATPLALFRTVAPVEVTVGGVKANVLFAGLTPQYTGLYQVNAQIPAGVVPGEAVPVTVAMAGRQSLAVTIAIR